jgi:hypothetical protein
MIQLKTSIREEMWVYDIVRLCVIVDENRVQIDYPYSQATHCTSSLPPSTIIPEIKIPTDLLIL